MFTKNKQKLRGFILTTLTIKNIYKKKKQYFGDDRKINLSTLLCRLQIGTYKKKFNLIRINYLFFVLIGKSSVHPL